MLNRRKTIRSSVRKEKVCYFCKEGKQPSFADVGIIKRFLTERNKIIPRERTGVCSKHQKALSKSIKHARHLALLPFVTRDEK